MEDLTGWWLDEYDGPRFRRLVDADGPTTHSEDPLSSASGPCWAWTGAKNSKGYGHFRMGQSMMLAHRIAWLDGGPKNTLPEDSVIDHLCRNPACVNPKHLEPVRQITNVERGLNGTSAKTSCIQGHEFTLENTRMVAREGSDFRRCVTCDRDRKRLAYQKRSETSKPA